MAEAAPEAGRVRNKSVKKKKTFDEVYAELCKSILYSLVVLNRTICSETSSSDYVKLQLFIVLKSCVLLAVQVSNQDVTVETEYELLEKLGAG